MDPRELDSIREDLVSADDEVRRLAVERLLLLPEDEALPCLVDCLGDPSWRVRKAAVERLVGWSSPARVPEALVEALADGENPGRRNAAVEALIGCGAAALPNLLEASHSPDADVRKLSIDALAGIADARGGERLLELLGDPDPNVRAASADALGVCDHTRAPARLIALATQPTEDTLVRLSALRALARAEMAVSVEELSGALEDELLRPAAFTLLGGSEDVAATEALLKGLAAASRTAREAAMEALLRIAGSSDAMASREVAQRIRENVTPEVLADAIQRLGSDILPHMKLMLMQFLGLLRAEDAALSILAAGREEVLTDAALGALECMAEVGERALDGSWSTLDAGDRCLACRVLGRTGGERARQRLANALSDPEPEVRSCAAEALAACGAVEVVPILIQHLAAAAAGREDGDSQHEIAVLGAALASLAGRTMGEPPAAERILDLLLARLEEAPSSERVQIARVLARLASPRSAAATAALLSDPTPGVRCAAVEALTRLDPRHEALREALVDEAAEVRVAACNALAGFTPSEVLGPLACLARDDDLWVRSAALRTAASLARRDVDVTDRQRLLELLQAALGDGDAASVVALEGLAAAGGREAARAALAALEREEPEVLQAAVRCIGSHGDPQCLERLIPLVAHVHWSVRAEAIEALANRGVTRSVPAILRRLEEEQDDFVRGVMLGALQRLEA